MRIKSSFKDYYDKAMMYGQDSLQYHRRPFFIQYKDVHGYGFKSPNGLFNHTAIQKAKIIEDESNCPFYTNHFNSSNNEFDVQTYVIGFCGKLYQAFHCTLMTTYGRKEEKYTLYNIEDLDKFFETHFPKELNKYYSQETVFYYEQDGLKGLHSRFQKSIKDFERIYRETQWDRTVEILIETYRTPVFIRCPDNTVLINGILNPLEFWRVFDHFTTYQEISMFLSNIAAPEKPIPQPSDIDMRDAKGFDKWSFRKESIKGK